MSIGPGGGLSIAPGGGLHVGPTGGLFIGASANPYRSNWPPIPDLLDALRERGMHDQYQTIGRAFGFLN